MEAKAAADDDAPKPPRLANLTDVSGSGAAEGKPAMTDLLTMKSAPMRPTTTMVMPMMEPMIKPNG